MIERPRGLFSAIALLRATAEKQAAHHSGYPSDRMATATPAPIAAAPVERLERELEGRLLRPGEPGYDEARRVWNARVDRRPSLIARCASRGAVARVLGFAREHGLPVSVRGSGHNSGGRAVRDGGLTIDLSCMSSVAVDPDRRTARAEAGATWGDLDRATQQHGLATPGARISTVGIAGVTLGGGYGWLMRMHGLTIDNLRAVDVVTGDGRTLTAGPGAHAELFWGLRGGGTLAIATAFEYDLHPVSAATCGVVYFPIDRAADVLIWYRERMAAAPDELTILFNIVTAPRAPFVPPPLQGSAVAALAVAHVGPAGQAQCDLAALDDLGPPLLATIKTRPYATLQRLFDAAGAYGRRVHGRAGHLAAIDDELVDVLARARPTSPLSAVMIAPLGGAVARIGADETAFDHRQARFDCAIDAVWSDPRDDERQQRWAEELWSAVRPFTDGVYVNELGDDREARMHEAYAPRTQRRLAQLRAAYDPGGVLDP